MTDVLFTTKMSISHTTEQVLEMLSHLKSNVQNYRKSMINTMEVFLNEIIKFQKHNVEAMKTK